MRGEAENDFHGEWSESEADFSPFARQLTITKARKLIRRHTKKFRTRQKGLLDFFFFFSVIFSTQYTHVDMLRPSTFTPGGRQNKLVLPCFTVTSLSVKHHNPLLRLIDLPLSGSSSQRESPTSPRETTPFESDSSSESSPYEDFHEEKYL